MTRVSHLNKQITQPLTVDINLSFTAEEYQKLQRGHISQDMDDKWDIFFQDNTLFFVRSWTGSCILELQLNETGSNTYIANQFLVEANTEIYRRSSDEGDRKLIATLLNWLING